MKYKEDKCPTNIGQNTELKGDIESSGDLRIDGNFIGSINIIGDLTIGKSGFVSGNIKAKNVDISGKVESIMVVDESTLIKSTAFIDGEIKTNKITVENGAVFNGKCIMLNKTI